MSLAAALSFKTPLPCAPCVADLGPYPCPAKTLKQTLIPALLWLPQHKFQNAPVLRPCEAVLKALNSAVVVAAAPVPIS